MHSIESSLPTSKCTTALISPQPCCDSREPILIEGEIGTGKHLFAEALQQQVCPELPLLTLSLADISPQRLEQKRFGVANQVGLLDMAGSGFLLLTQLALPHDLASRLERYAFPGNITELKSLTFTAVRISNGQELSLAPFFKALEQTQPLLHSERITFPANLPTIREITEQLIHEALIRTNNNQSAAAKRLGITQSALSRRLGNAGISKETGT